MINLSLSIGALLLAFVATSTQVMAQNKTVSLPANLDTAIFANSGALSSGQGILVTGLTQSFGARRALVSFDLDKAIPAGSRIISVDLEMSSTKTSIITPVSTSMHRVTAKWGEGTSNASNGAGAPAVAGDATWTHRVFNTQAWAKTGGDFISTASATVKTGVLARYKWTSTTSLVSDAQAMLDTPAGNFGWLLMTTEIGKTATLWANREHLIAALRPVLTVVYRHVTASVVASGKGCIANGRSLDHSATGLPKLGNGSFAFQAVNGPPAGVAILFLAAGLQKPPLPLNANKCFLYLNFRALGPSFAAVFGNTGSVSFPFPVPNNASLYGIVFETQMFSIGPGLTLRSSNALTNTVGS